MTEITSQSPMSLQPPTSESIFVASPEYPNLQITRKIHSEMETLRHQMTRPDSPASVSSFFAHSGNLANSVSAFHSQSNLPWIIDSGASDHMTYSSSLFSDYKPCSGQDKVKIADGTGSSVSGKGSIRITPSLPLSSVLHVPSFSNNLLSISRLTRELNCRVTFFPSHCVF